MRPLEARLDPFGAGGVAWLLSDAEVVARLRAGDQRLLESLVESQPAVMIAGASRYVKSRCATS
jgi:hypothetical protein